MLVLIQVAGSGYWSVVSSSPLACACWGCLIWYKKKYLKGQEYVLLFWIHYYLYTVILCRCIIIIIKLISNIIIFVITLCCILFNYHTYCPGMHHSLLYVGFCKSCKCVHKEEFSLFSPLLHWLRLISRFWLMVYHVPCPCLSNIVTTP